MGASITLAGANLIAQKQAAQQSLDIQRFIFANVPGLDVSAAVDRAAAKPAAAQIVYSAEIPNDNAGYVNPGQVVYSLQVGSDVGDWDFNWIGLESAEGVLFAVAYVPLQQKRRNIPPLQIGNNVTRNFLVVFDGAMALTGITIDARTWQHDFTARLAGIDERERLSNRDIYGRACFFGSSLQLEKVGTAYQLKPGTAYIEGIRLVLAAALPVVPPALPSQAWLDVVLQRELSDVAARWKVVFGPDKVDYTDAVGIKHYCIPIASLTVATVVDSRSVEPINGPLVQQFALREGDYSNLRARGTTKADVGLGNLPNAKSSDPSSNEDNVLATTAALHRTTQQAVDGMALPLAALPYPTIATTDNRIAVTATAAAGNGGTITIPEGVRIALSEEVEAGATGRLRAFKTVSWTSPALTAGRTYFVRAMVTTEGLAFYVQLGTDSDVIPAGQKGVPGAATGGGFDSTALDMLVARVVTGAIGSIPTVTTLANAAVLRVKSIAYDTFSRTSQRYILAAKRLNDLVLNWARRPAVHMAHFGYTIEGQFNDPEDMHTYYSGSVADTSGTLTAIIDRYVYAPVAQMDTNTISANVVAKFLPLTTDYSVMA
ncbi:phage tail-collar fiber domain-containing protein [Pseudomonas quasicaspiana]|uniref:phage tail-collar fiber domain-containing protein n=1 Tax=Pseudomonas quasicaspiana TaxID=2829821 RepID=UPI001E3C9C93|nr:phage tail protein [Pseudomonas quasicaspiana]MCD5970435.1 phage tail protein [Pseudomonas quasicaspiana]